ncbi:MFS transporter [Paraburkholderia silviterrae]|uniref:MFS transporter n=1 Tax=Paraburkholderia silviterrae TaxID=2528715 RepID=A0A4R5M0R0_9BURK|nr:MFS transporter [Paraburkholderia silviterrae]TDG18777.1 MFS transporter [Paraburkholderia silviterrae]
MSVAVEIDVADVMNKGRMGPFQLVTLALCAMCMIVDGFDVQAISYVAPAIVREWHIAKASLGPVFSASLAGMLLGSLAFTPLADRLGRRPVLIASTLLLATFMAATPLAASVDQLIAWRLLAGLSLGAIIPNAVALASEYSPPSIRVSVMMIVSVGFVLGGLISGTSAAWLIPAFGWHAVFYVGAVVPLLSAALMAVALPESMQFLIVRQRHREKVRKWLARIDPALTIGEHTVFVVRERANPGSPVLNLFRDGKAMGTLMLWAMNFSNLLCVFFLANWLPLLMNDAGHSTSLAVMAGAVMWCGGIASNLLLGRVVERFGFTAVLTCSFIVAGLAMASIGEVRGVAGLALAAIFVAGFCVLGNQTALNALAATYYPTSIRATGMGWALGSGRLGSIVGPVVGGVLLRLRWPTEQLFFCATIPLVVAVVAVLMFDRLGLSAEQDARGQLDVRAPEALDGGAR